MNIIAMIVVPVIAGLFLYRLNWKLPLGWEGKTFFNMVTILASAALFLQAVGWYR